jgi:hypothetical protein
MQYRTAMVPTVERHEARRRDVVQYPEPEHSARRQFAPDEEETLP